MASVLVIEDDPQVRAVLRAVLEGAGHQVLEAADGAQGLATVRRRAVDLVFCDLFMPGKEGLEATPLSGALTTVLTTCSSVLTWMIPGAGGQGLAWTTSGPWRAARRARSR